MIDRVLYDWAPLVALVAVALFVIDWTLTHVGAAASKRVAERWAVEGSYELNPTWQADVDAGRRFAWRMVGVAVALAALLLAMRYVVELGELDPAIFAVAAGAVLLLQAPTIMVHANNLQTFRDLADPTAITERQVQPLAHPPPGGLVPGPVRRAVARPLGAEPAGVLPRRHALVPALWAAAREAAWCGTRIARVRGGACGRGEGE